MSYPYGFVHSSVVKNSTMASGSIVSSSGGSSGDWILAFNSSGISLYFQGNCSAVHATIFLFSGPGISQNLKCQVSRAASYPPPVIPK